MTKHLSLSIMLLALVLALAPTPATAGEHEHHDHSSHSSQGHDDHGSGQEEVSKVFVCPMPSDAYHADKAGECPYCGMKLAEKPFTPATLAEVGGHLTNKFTKLLGKEKWADLNAQFAQAESLHGLFHDMEFSDKDAAKPSMTVVHEQTKALGKAIAAKDSAGVKSTIGALRKAYEALGKLEAKAGDDDSKAMGNAMCPVSGEPVDSSVFTVYEGEKVFFCCQKCKSKFEANPGKYLEEQKDKSKSHEGHDH